MVRRMTKDPVSPVSDANTAISEIEQAATSANTLRSKIEGRTISEGELAAIGREFEAIEASLLQAKKTILDLRQSLIEAREESAALREETASADSEGGPDESRAPEREQYERKREQYERKKVGQSWVMVPEGEDEPHYCLTCFAQGQIIPLQPMGSLFASTATHNCPRCGMTFLLE